MSVGDAHKSQFLLEKICSNSIKSPYKQTLV
jgi:folate-dependent tRNA-U54 methylase TrmFO/GidA